MQRAALDTDMSTITLVACEANNGTGLGSAHYSERVFSRAKDGNCHLLILFTGIRCESTNQIVLIMQSATRRQSPWGRGKSQRWPAAGHVRASAPTVRSGRELCATHRDETWGRARSHSSCMPLTAGRTRRGAATRPSARDTGRGARGAGSRVRGRTAGRGDNFAPHRTLPVATLLITSHINTQLRRSS